LLALEVVPDTGWGGAHAGFLNQFPRQGTQDADLRVLSPTSSPIVSELRWFMAALLPGPLGVCPDAPGRPVSWRELRVRGGLTHPI